MYVFVIFGALLMALSALMVANPKTWAEGIVKFSRQRYFHAVEVISRAGFGVLFVFYADQTKYPLFLAGMGYLLASGEVNMGWSGGRRGAS